MAKYLVELYVPRTDAAAARRFATDARGAAEQLTREGTAVRYERSIFVPDDETCSARQEKEARTMWIESRVGADRAGGKRDGIAKPASATPTWMTIHALTWILAASGVVVASRASADPLTLIEDGRFVVAEDCSQFGCPGPMATPPSPFASWVGGVSAAGQSAIQSSSVSQNATEAMMQGSLASGPNTANPNPDAQALSHFQVIFDAVEAAQYELSGDLDYAFSPELWSFAAVEFWDVTENQALYAHYDPGPIGHSGNLTVGHRYRLLLFTQSVYDSSASLDFEFVVPEPGRLLSLASGLILVAILAPGRPRCA